MKIIHVLQGRCNPDKANGVVKTVYFLAKAQASLGARVAVFSISGSPPVDIPGVETASFAANSRGIPAVPPHLLNALEFRRPNLVHLHSAYVPPNAAIAAWLRRRRIPYVVTPNGVLDRSVLGRRLWVKLPYKWFFERPMLQRAAFIHSVGDTRQIREYGVRAPIVEAPNGIDLVELPKLEDLRRCRPPEWKKRTVVLFVGRLDVMQKGLDALLDAFALARVERPELLLVLVGPNYGNSATELRSRCRRLGIWDGVVLHGPEFGRRKLELIASADFFVHLSRWEGLPFAVVEALALGRPCVVTPAADPINLIGRSGAGMVTRLDARDAADAFVTMVEIGQDRRNELGNAGRRLVGRELRWDSIAEMILAGYRRYCNVHGAAALRAG